MCQRLKEKKNQYYPTYFSFNNSPQASETKPYIFPYLPYTNPFSNKLRLSYRLTFPELFGANDSYGETDRLT